MRLKRIMFLLAAIIICVYTIMQSGAASLEQVLAETVTSNLAPVAISDNGKYLLDVNGEPFFWMGDTAWEMHHRLTREEIVTYLDDRQQKGITVILFMIPFFDLADEPQHDNRYGDIPFIDQDITQPNESYFQLVDFSLTEMEKRGITAGFVPLWGFVIAGKNGFKVSDADVSTYAQWLSNRYKERKNIIWISGGDTGVDPQWAILGRELKTADPEKLVTFHPGRDGISSYHMWGDADWLDFHMTQTGHSPNLAANYKTINSVYNSSSKPILNGEPAYEDIRVKIPNKDPFKMPPHQVRKAAYWSLLAGGFGHVYGHVEIIQFAAAMPDQPFTYGADSYWMEALDAPGVNQISYLSSLLRSVPWHTFSPRQNLIVSANPIGPAHIRAARSADLSRAFIYFPERQSAKIQLAELVGPLKVRWFDPSTGQAQQAGIVEATGSVAFTAPFAEDSLLILEPAVDPTATHTPLPPTATATEALPTLTPTATPDPAATNTPTATTAASTATATSTPTPTHTPVLPTATPTQAAVNNCLPQPGETLINGGFEDGSGDWSFSTDGSGSFSVSAPAYSCGLAARVRINVRGKVMQFYQLGVPLKANTAYRLTYAAFSESGNDLTAELLKHTSPYTNYGLSQTVNLGTGWQLYSVDFTTSGFTNEVNDGRLRFRLYGKNNDTYWIDAVSLVEVSAAAPTETATATSSAAATSTPTATLTHTPTATPVSVPTDTPTATETATPDPAATNTPTATTAASTATATSTPTPTHTPMLPTATPTQAAVNNCLPQPGETIINGSFEDGSGDWSFSTDGSGSFSVSAPAYSCGLAARVRINVRGKVMQFYQLGVPLKANTAYRLTYAAFSESGNDLTAELLKHTSPYTNYGLSQTVNLGTGWQLYSVDFTTSGFTNEINDGRLRFRLYGKNNDTYWIDAVSLQEIGAPASAAAPTSPVQNPSGFWTALRDLSDRISSLAAALSPNQPATARQSPLVSNSNRASNPAAWRSQSKIERCCWCQYLPVFAMSVLELSAAVPKPGWHHGSRHSYWRYARKSGFRNRRRHG